MSGIFFVIFSAFHSFVKSSMEIKRMIKLLRIMLLLLPINTVASPLPDKPHVYVEGSAEIEVQADTVNFSVLLDSTDDDLSKARHNVEERSKKLISTCLDIGIDRGKISSTPLNISPATEYKDGENISVGTQVSRQVDIQINDLSKYKEVMSALIEANISKTVETTLSVSNDATLTDDALLKALADAKSRAERIALAQGMKLGEPFSISEIPTRGEERYTLYPSRRIEGKSGQVRGKLAFSSGESFEPGKMVARAQVFAVYLLK